MPLVVKTEEGCSAVWNLSGPTPGVPSQPEPHGESQRAERKDDARNRAFAEYGDSLTDEGRKDGPTE